LFLAKGSEAYLETSAANGFSFDLMIHLWGGPPALLIFLKQRHSRPDIAGFIKNTNGDKEIIMAEIKGLPLTLNDIYQLRKYVDLFNAAHAFLITSHPIPDNVKRLIKFAPRLIPQSPCKNLILAQFDTATLKFTDWYPKSSF
jgi:hypothetical protein